MLEVRDLSFSYGDRPVLEEISFGAGSGRIVSILGPNGAGKTTLLKCLCGILRPRRGAIEIGGQDIARLSRMELARRVAYVPQRSETSRTLVFDAVLIGRRPHIDWSVTRRDLELVWEVMRLVGLEDLALRGLDEISGGEYQKVIIARAMVQEPRVLILDEPTNNLDLTNQHAALRLVTQIVRERRICTVMSMHDINLALLYSDELIFIRDRRIVRRGGAGIVDAELIGEVYGLEAEVIPHRGVPLVVPRVAAVEAPPLVHAGRNRA